MSLSPEEAIQDMMGTIDTIRDVYARETEALTAANTRAFLDMQEEKLQAARKYQIGIEAILNRRGDFKNVNPVMKKRLADMQAEFAAITRKNMEALDRMQRCVHRMGETISSAARETAAKNRTFSYGENGKAHVNVRQAVSMGISETA